MSEIKTTSTAPSPEKQTDVKQQQATHVYFIPVILTIVVCIIIVATFFDGSESKHSAGADDTDHPAGAIDHIATQQDSIQSPKIQKPPVSVQAANDAGVLHKAENSAERFHYDSKQPGFSQPEYPRYNRRMSREEERALRRERQRRAYEEHLKQREQHLQEMHNYRNTVLRRFEKDRTDLRKRMYELDAEARRIRLETEKRLQLLQSSEPRWSM